MRLKKYIHRNNADEMFISEDEPRVLPKIIIISRAQFNSKNATIDDDTDMSDET